MRKLTLVLLTASLIASPYAAHAQSQFIKDNAAEMIRKVGVHVNTSFRKPTDDDVTRGGRIYGVSVGLSPGETNGWRYPIGLTMFSEKLLGPSGAPFALLRARAIMAGVGYGWHFGKLSTGAQLQGGFSVNRVQAEGDPLGAFNLSGGDVFVDVKNAFLLRPQVKAEYYLTRKLTLRASADYVLTRPDITVHIPGGSISDRWDASHFHANVGIGVYPFHK
jgi:hypothetical protein